MMAMRTTERVYDTEASRNKAAGALRRMGWNVTRRGQREVDGTTVYWLRCHRLWPTVGRLLRALVAAKQAFLAIMSGGTQRAA